MQIGGIEPLSDLKSLFMSFGFLSPKDSKIIWLSNMTLSVPDEGYFRSASCEITLMYTFIIITGSIFLLYDYLSSGIPSI